MRRQQSQTRQAENLPARQPRGSSLTSTFELAPASVSAPEAVPQKTQEEAAATNANIQRSVSKSRERREHRSKDRDRRRDREREKQKGDIVAGSRDPNSILAHTPTHDSDPLQRETVSKNNPNPSILSSPSLQSSSPSLPVIPAVSDIEQKESKVPTEILEPSTTSVNAQSSSTPSFSASPSFTIKQGQSPLFPTVALRRVEKRVFRSLPSLFRIKGRRKYHVLSVAVSPIDMSSNDVYILETPLPEPIIRPKNSGDDFEEIRAVLFVWYGSGSGMVKRARGKEVCFRIREKDWGLKAEIVEDKENTLEQIRFWASFPKSEEWGGDILRTLAIDCNIADDLEYEKNCDSNLTLYGLNEDGAFIKIAGGRDLFTSIINSGTCFILNSTGECVFLWIGRTSRDDVRELASEFANVQANSKGVQVQIERDLNESVLFMEKFQDWTDKVSIEVAPPKNIAAKDKTRKAFDRGAYVKAAEKIDVFHMLNPLKGIASWERQADGSTEVIDVGGPPPKILDRRKLDLKTWVAVGSDLVEVADHGGVFYSGDSYLFLYRNMMGYDGNEKEVAIVYFWIGDDTKPTEAGAIAHAAVELERKHDTRSIRVSQGHEPEHFLSIFRPVSQKKDEPYDPIIIRRGVQSMLESADKVLFSIGGIAENQVRAVQVVWNVASFNSSSVFLITTNDSGVIWIGNGACKYEIDAAWRTAHSILGDKPIEEVEESREPRNFWKQFGVENERNIRTLYASEPFLSQKSKYYDHFKRRMFKVSHVFNGGATAEHISPFTQTDLSGANVYIIDGFFEIYVWVGHKAKEQYKDIKLALSTAIEYSEYVRQQEVIRLDYDNTKSQVPVWIIHEGEETFSFKSCFSVFDDGLTDFGNGSSNLYFTWLQEEISKRRHLGKPRAELAKSVLDIIENGLFSVDAVRSKNLPLGVNPATAETHLSPDDFKKLFGVDLVAYSAFPAWKQVEMKKKAGLF
ncbi:hypothetical protein HK100_009556 [Physocladia obscura]|uniref:HP domain-containing protein n=1 Tax=Physocladia obscura TaxID=109957 RepID=A0AAD5T363_9FUNG|nr:hypothetical protein HK100_009556 [Physocladia obscura]